MSLSGLDSLKICYLLNLKTFWLKINGASGLHHPGLYVCICFQETHFLLSFVIVPDFALVINSSGKYLKHEQQQYHSFEIRF